MKYIVILSVLIVTGVAASVLYDNNKLSVNTSKTQLNQHGTVVNSSTTQSMEQKTPAPTPAQNVDSQFKQASPAQKIDQPVQQANPEQGTTPAPTPAQNVDSQFQQANPQQVTPPAAQQANVLASKK